jgi:hypothetical protein
MKRLFFALLVVLAFASQAQAWSLKNAASCPDNNGGNGINASCSIDSSGADLLVVSYGSFAGSAGTVSDSHSITWTCKTLLNTNGYTTQMCYAWSGSTGFGTGSGHTITISASSSFIGATFSAWIGSKTSADPFDGEQTETQSSSFTTGTCGPLTPTGGANDLFVTTGMGHGTTEFDAATVTSWTMAARQVYVGGSSLGNQQWWTTGTGATSAVWNFSASPNNLDCLAFLPGSGAAATVHNFAATGAGK